MSGITPKKPSDESPPPEKNQGNNPPKSDLTKKTEKTYKNPLEQGSSSRSAPPINPTPNPNNPNVTGVATSSMTGSSSSSSSAVNAPTAREIRLFIIPTEIGEFLKTLPRGRNAIEEALRAWLTPRLQGNPDLIANLFRSNWRITNYSEPPISNEELTKLNVLSDCIRSYAQDNNCPLDIPKIKMAEKLTYVEQNVRFGRVEYLEDSGQFQLLNTFALRKSLRDRGIPFAPQAMNDRYLIINTEKDFDRWFDGIREANKAFETLKKKLPIYFSEGGDTFDDEDDNRIPWGITLERNLIDSYTIKIPESTDFLKKKYSVFSFLKELGIIPKETVFKRDTILPDLTGKDLIKFINCFEVQEEFEKTLREVMSELDPHISINTGGALASDFYSVQIREADEALCNELRITKDVLDNLRQGKYTPSNPQRQAIERSDHDLEDKQKISREMIDAIRSQEGSVIYPAALQLKTRSDEVMLLLEKYYAEFKFPAKGGQAKTFIDHTRESGLLHVSNLSLEHFLRIKQRFNRLFFIQDEVGKTRALNTNQIIRLEIDGKMLRTYIAMRVDKILEFLETIDQIPEIDKAILRKELSDLVRVTSYSDLVEKEKLFWKKCVNRFTEIDIKGLTAPVSTTFTPAEVNTRLYNNLVNPTPTEKIETLCTKLKANPHFIETDQRYGGRLTLNINAFLGVARSKINGRSAAQIAQSEVLLKMGLEFFEQIIYRIEYAGLSKQQFENFFVKLISIDWVGCSEGFTEKIQELLLRIGGQESADQTLLEMRNGLVEDFANIHYGQSNEVSMYLGGIQAAVNGQLGLGRAYSAPSGWGADKAPEAQCFVMSNYTPDDIYKTIYHEKNELIGSAIAQNTAQAIESALAGLGVPPAAMGRYYDRVTNEFNVPAIQFDMPFLVLNFCVNNHYLKYQRNTVIDPQYERALYNDKIQRETAQRNAYHAPVHHQPAPFVPSYVPSYSGGGGCRGGMN